MIFAAAIIFVALFWGGYRLLEEYVRRSMRSYAAAERTWAEVKSAATDLMAHDVGAELARNVLMLVWSAGCGCYVRSLLMHHYLPGFFERRGQQSADIDKGFREIDALSADARADFHRLVAMVMVYDSFRNPLQGWLFRRVLRSYLTKPGYREIREAELASYAVLAKKPSKVAARAFA